MIFSRRAKRGLHRNFVAQQLRKMSAESAPHFAVYGYSVCPFLLHAFLRQARIRTAVRARTARRDYEVLFKGMKARQLAGQVRERASQASKRFARMRVRGCGACVLYVYARPA